MMNFIQQAFKGRNDWTYYLGSFFLVVFGWQFIGILPLFLVGASHATTEKEFFRAMKNNFLGLGIDKNLYLILMILTFIFGLVFLLLSVKYIHKRPITSLITSRKKIDWKRFFTAFIIWGTVAVVSTVVSILIAPEHFTWNFKPTAFLVLLLVSFLMLPFQTSFEELFFRGYIFQAIGVATTTKKFVLYFLFVLLAIVVVVLSMSMLNFSFLESVMLAVLFVIVNYFIDKYGCFSFFVNSSLYSKLTQVLTTSFTPVFITSVIFGLMHLANPEVAKMGYITMVFYIGTGFFYGIVTVMDDGLELPMGLHAANNIMAAFLVTTNWTVFQTDALYIDTSEPSVGFEMFFPVLVLYPLILFVFSKKYNWTSWNKKLFAKTQKLELRDN